MLIYLKNNNNKWVDFSDKFMKMTTVSHKSGDTITTSTFSTTISNLIMDNSDNYWDTPSNWQNNWNLSKNKSEVFLKGTDVLLREKIINKGQSNIYSLGHYKINRLYTKGSKAILKLNSYSQWLNKKNKKADKAKNGKVWYQQRSVSFLLEELLKLHLNADDVEGTVTNISGSTLTLDTRVPDWSVGAQIKDKSNSQKYNIYKKVGEFKIDVKVIDDNDSFAWTSNTDFVIDGSNSLPDSYTIPDRLIIPTFGGIRVFSPLGMTPTDVRRNFYSGG